MTAGEVLFLERASCIINSELTTTKFFVLFLYLLFFWAHTNQALKATAAVSTVRTASTAEQPSIGPAQSSKIHTPEYNCRSTFVSTRVRQRKRVGMKE